uniref:ABC transporter substrate-binding protein n=1 Tax=Globisporangium ultimum (strain ATCC 200006 / CBS 805.95 / DAOM BR144) TaxID=431595 RepID=K3X2B9_GLOUD
MRMPLWTAVAAAASVALLQQQVQARGVSVNLTASWPSSPHFPLLETSEFLAEENPAFFWQYIDLLQPQTTVIADKSRDVDALAEFAVQNALT